MFSQHYKRWRQINNTVNLPRCNAKPRVIISNIIISMTLVSGKSVNSVILLAIPPTYSPANESFIHVPWKICPGERSTNFHLICFTDNRSKKKRKKKKKSTFEQVFVKNTKQNRHIKVGHIQKNYRHTISIRLE